MAQSTQSSATTSAASTGINALNTGVSQIVTWLSNSTNRQALVAAIMQNTSTRDAIQGLLDALNSAISTGTLNKANITGLNMVLRDIQLAMQSAYASNAAVGNAQINGITALDNQANASMSRGVERFSTQTTPAWGHAANTSILPPFVSSAAQGQAALQKRAETGEAVMNDLFVKTTARHMYDTMGHYDPTSFLEGLVAQKAIYDTQKAIKQR